MQLNLARVQLSQVPSVVITEERMWADFAVPVSGFEAAGDEPEYRGKALTTSQLAGTAGMSKVLLSLVEAIIDLFRYPNWATS